MARLVERQLLRRSRWDSMTHGCCVATVRVDDDSTGHGCGSSIVHSRGT
jgi:hypothetical protein